ncbi:RsmD family RNA methyltransferase [Olsenella porci]|uniref:RsmD family RNA methyltransferase n=1 Tax=Olsenella porci TaxID=2652279 RepID=UPI0012B34383|nr:RsmD family RNA methyltransferase [Olsenella porci]
MKGRGRLARVKIVGGAWRGRSIQVPEGREVTRPTMDRTRESMASMVLSAFGLDLSEVRVLDAFAGSGAIGFELLSRGALSCTFVDRDATALRCVRSNSEALGARPPRVTATRGDVLALARRGRVPGGPFSLVVLDPPYAVAAESVSGLVRDLRAAGLLNDGAVILYERSADAPDLDVDGAELVSERGRGITAVSLWRLGGSHE